MSQYQTQHVFKTIYDVAIFGGGYAGYAAAQELSAKGKTVLLIDTRGDLLWESGRAMDGEIGSTDQPQYASFIDDLRSRDAADESWLDPAIAEVTATELLKASDIHVLYYATPVAVERIDEQIASAIVATKQGKQRVCAKQWIDASERGTLLRLADSSLSPREADALSINLIFQHTSWREDAPVKRALWDCARVLNHELGADQSPRDVLLDALDRLSEEDQKAVMTHTSVEPIRKYDAAEGSTDAVCNIASASPAFSSGEIQTLADRFALGIAAAERVDALSKANVDASQFGAPIDDVQPIGEISSQVVVAGAGTGGAIAAIAAGRGGADVLCVDPMLFAGGIGSGGGIHSYYFGVMGGIQDEVDKAIKDMMPTRGRTLSGGPFNPEAKKVVLEKMMRDAGVEILFGAGIYDVTVENGRITSAMAATADGPIRIVADAWVDATGDGDLCAFADVPSNFGRAGDGQPHAYSQSGGSLREVPDGYAMTMINFDAGWCDPTDSADLTRARIEAINQYSSDKYEILERPTYVAPAIGLRQSRQVQTDYVLQLDDVIKAKQFEDVIGYTGCHYDNHATDYEFESDEGMFWVWGNGCWREHIGCELSYRQLLPVTLSNVWLGCRAFGVSQDAHHIVRMQRDMQRIGEAAGTAAAMAVKHQKTIDSRTLEYSVIREALEQAGTLQPPKEGEEAIFNFTYYPEKELSADDFADELKALDAGESGTPIWTLYQHHDAVEDAVVQRLTSDNESTSWHAAATVAMWQDSRAEARLVAAIESREIGDEGREDHPMFKNPGNSQSPRYNVRRVPHWFSAIALLRCCGSDACLPVIKAAVENEPLTLTLRTTVAITLQRLADAGRITDKQLAGEILKTVAEGELPDPNTLPQRGPGPLTFALQAGDTERAKVIKFGEGRGWLPDTRHSAIIDNRWQHDLAIAKAASSLGVQPPKAVESYLSDDRLIVRRAFEKVAQLATV